MDEDHPGWDAPSGRGRKRQIGGGTAPRYAYGQLVTGWINLASMLLRELGVQAWSIEPLVSRSLQHPGVVTTFELDRDGHVEIGELDHDRVKLDAVPDGLLRPVRDVEPRYTLERAREILAGCTRHEWTVQLDGDGHPVGVRCASPHCEEQRPLAT